MVFASLNYYLECKTVEKKVFSSKTCYFLHNSETELPSNIQLAIRGLDQQADEVLRREANATEERIKRYSEMQYAALEAFKEQADLEHNILVR